jgi:glycopeptide antibiotics resistance protein
LTEDEKIAVPPDFEQELKFDYKTNKRFLFTALVLFYLKGVVAMTTTPSSGQVHESRVLIRH